MVSLCNFTECKLKSLQFIGECKYCKNQHCSIHRLPESHLCLHLKDIISKERDILAKNLEKNSLRMSKRHDNI